jgi:TatD DNase family protein
MLDGIARAFFVPGSQQQCEPIVRQRGVVVAQRLLLAVATRKLVRKIGERTRIFRVVAVLDAAFNVQPRTLGCRRRLPWQYADGRARGHDARKAAEAGNQWLCIQLHLKSLACSVQCVPSMTNASTGDFSPNATTVSPALIDIGINLTHDSYDKDRDAVLARAAAAGVTQMVVTGSSGTSSHNAAELARSHPGRLFATAGVHPHHATELSAELESTLEHLARNPEIVAVGECGLDYFRDFSPRDVQRDAFARQLEIAARVGKPVFLHQRDAHDDFIAILREHRSALAHGAVAHCFTGNGKELAACLELGLAIGITGWICDDRRGGHLVPLMREIPAQRLMLETDGPYLLPRDLSPKPASRRNEPAYLPHIAREVARARGESVEQLAQTSTAAARSFFGLPEEYVVSD